MPWVLKKGSDRIRHILAFLDGVGLGGVRLANAFPAVLGCSVDTKLRPVVHFVTLTMGRSVTELQTGLFSGGRPHPIPCGREGGGGGCNPGS